MTLIVPVPISTHLYLYLYNMYSTNITNTPPLVYFSSVVLFLSIITVYFLNKSYKILLLSVKHNLLSLEMNVFMMQKC